MANVPTVHFVEKDGIKVVCVLVSADMYHDGFKGVNYVNYDCASEKVVGYGYSKGFGPNADGAGSMITGRQNATNAAMRYINRKKKGSL
jgi:hypothetical protein